MLQNDTISYFAGADSMQPENESAITWRNYASLAAFLFLIIDYAYLLSTEVKYIWRSNMRLSKVLYIFSRYVPMCVQIINYSFVQKWLLHSPVPTVRCQAWFWILAMALSASVIVMDTILLLRIYALYLKNNKVFFLAVPLLAEHIIAQVVIIRSAIITPSFNEYCDLTKTPIIIVPLGALTLLSHIGLWFAIYSKRKVSEAAVLTLVVKESHMTLALFIFPVFFFIPWSFHFRTNPFIIFVWPITIISITSCRIVLSMLQLKTEDPSSGPPGVDTTDFLFTTILDSRARDSHELDSRMQDSNALDSMQSTHSSHSSPMEIR